MPAPPLGNCLCQLPPERLGAFRVSAQTSRGLTEADQFFVRYLASRARRFSISSLHSIAMDIAGLPADVGGYCSPTASRVGRSALSREQVRMQRYGTSQLLFGRRALRNIMLLNCLNCPVKVNRVFEFVIFHFVVAGYCQ